MLFEENNKAIYIQIADRICDEIVNGIYPPDSRLPSVREYAADMQVNANTVMRSYERLAQQGYIYNRRGIGFFISLDARQKILDARGSDLVDNRLENIFSLLSHLNIDPDQLRDAYRDYLLRNSK
ncbi:MAG: GntR family transcriptional regulator [Muribaculaceae bacterium]|nr:GntR family transcriptional regulator [Muribaculaceae bacterium]